MTTSDQVQLLTDALVEHGFRVTPARRAIIVSLVRCGGHISADDLAELVRLETPQVGRATVFRTLELLSDLGLIRPIYQGTAAAHYVLMADGSHHHLICRRCHNVIEFDDCQGEALATVLAQRFNFQVQSHLLEVYGLCEACRH